MRSMLLVLSLVSMVMAEAAMADDKAADDLRGTTWKAWKAEDADKMHRFREVWTFKENNIVAVTDENEAKSEFKYRHDSTKNPKEIDITYESGPAKGKILKGIYKIEKDELTICYIGPKSDEPEKRDRPTEFDVLKRADVVILSFARKK